jgi:hypothetical protein
MQDRIKQNLFQTQSTLHKLSSSFDDDVEHAEQSKLSIDETISLDGDLQGDLAGLGDLNGELNGDFDLFFFINPNPFDGLLSLTRNLPLSSLCLPICSSS